MCMYYTKRSSSHERPLGALEKGMLVYTIARLLDVACEAMETP